MTITEESLSGRKITLISKDGVKHEVPVEVASMSVLVKDMLDDSAEDDDTNETPEMPLPNVSNEILLKVIEYCNHNQFVDEMKAITTPLQSDKLDQIVQKWYADFVNVERTVLFSMVAAANYLDIKSLLDLTCLAVAILIKGKSATELREMFNMGAPVATGEGEAQAAAVGNENIDSSNTA